MIMNSNITEKMMNVVFNKIICKCFLLVVFLRLSVAADTLLPNRTIAIDQTLVCESQLFELAFFRPGTSTNMFLGVRYKNTPDVVVWVANRNQPITDSNGVVFSISGNGSLAISRGRTIIWSENPSFVASNPVLQLLDSGNLVVVDKTREAYTWQSFDYPTDSWLPGFKVVDDVGAGVERYLTSWKRPNDPSPGDFVFRIQNLGLPELVILKGGNKTYRSGQYNGVQFSGMPSFPNSIFKPNLSFSNGRLISISRPYDSSVFTRTKLDESGFMQRYTLNSRRDMWSFVYSFPEDTCDKYGHCGPYTICRNEQVPRCQCLEGFTPKSQNDWDLQEWSGGCTRKKPLICGGGDDFLEVRGVKYPDMVKFWLDTRMSLLQCKAECLKNCSCTAYANINVTNGGSGCLIWVGDLIDIREVYGADSNQNLYIRIPIQERDTRTDLDKNEEGKKRRRRPTKVIVILITSGVLSAAFIVGAIILMRRRKKRASKVNSRDLELPLFKFETIVAATKDFSRENLIGEGGFGPVYKGKLSAEEEIAVKRLSKTSQQGPKEFKNEVILIAKLQHRNLVRLLGCCIEGEERMLIYEFLQNKSLNCFIFDQSRKSQLTWSKRFDIIMGIARGLLYLHQDSRLKIIHRDLKASNVLLDGDLNPKISDFGLARILGEGECATTTRRVVGTYGYMAPEYAVDGKYSVKSDIFAFGVILLEIVSGKKNRGFDHCDHYHTLLGHAWLLWKENNILELMDGCLRNTCMESQVERCIHVGLLCVQKFAQDRPFISSVILMLGSDEGSLPKPKEPGFFIERSSSCTTVTCQETITELEAR